METKRAGIYPRVSKDEQVQHGYSLETQEQACRTYCQERGWAVIGVFREEGVSENTGTAQVGRSTGRGRGRAT